MSQYLLQHPTYGQAVEAVEPGVFVGNDGVTFVAALWGPSRIFAVVPANEIVVAVPDEEIVITITIVPGDGS